MAMTDLMLEYLLENKVLKIPDFGTFFLKDAPAFLDEKSGAILPPGKEITFDVNYDLKDRTFADYLVNSENKSASEISLKLNELSSYWKKILETKYELEIKEFGSFFANDKHLTFRGKHFSTETPENFGLEKFNISELKSRKSYKKNSAEKDYATTRTRFWWILLLIPITAIVYFGTQNPELIFGKKSFENLKKTDETPISKSKKPQKDSLKIDSLKSKTLPQNIK